MTSLTAFVRYQELWYVAQCAEIDVASQGASPEEALSNLIEALILHRQEPESTQSGPAPEASLIGQRREIAVG